MEPRIWGVPSINQINIECFQILRTGWGILRTVSFSALLLLLLFTFHIMPRIYVIDLESACLFAINSARFLIKVFFVKEFFGVTPRYSQI